MDLERRLAPTKKPLVDTETDRLIRQGKYLNLQADFHGLPDPYAATLSADKHDVTSYGTPERPIVRLYPRDGVVWWEMREQVKQLRKAVGLEEFESSTPQQILSSDNIRELRKEPLEVDTPPGIEQLGDATVETLTGDERKQYLAKRSTFM